MRRRKHKHVLGIRRGKLWRSWYPGLRRAQSTPEHSNCCDLEERRRGTERGRERDKHTEKVAKRERERVRERERESERGRESVCERERERVSDHESEAEREHSKTFARDKGLFQSIRTADSGNRNPCA